MKKLLLIGGIGAAAYAAYLFLYGKKEEPKEGEAVIVKKPVRSKTYPESAREEFDTAWDALFPSSRTAIGSHALTADSVDTFQGWA